MQERYHYDDEYIDDDSTSLSDDAIDQFTEGLIHFSTPSDETQQISPLRQRIRNRFQNIPQEVNIEQQVTKELLLQGYTLDQIALGLGRSLGEVGAILSEVNGVNGQGLHSVDRLSPTSRIDQETAFADLPYEFQRARIAILLERHTSTHQDEPVSLGKIAREQGVEKKVIEDIYKDLVGRYTLPPTRRQRATTEEVNLLDELVESLRNQGMNNAEITEYLQIEYHLVADSSERLIKAGKIVARQGRFDHGVAVEELKNLEEIQQDLDGGMSLRKVAQKYSLSVWVVRKIKNYKNSSDTSAL